MAENTKTAGAQASHATAAASAKPLGTQAHRPQAGAQRVPAAKSGVNPALKAKKPKKKVSGALVVGLVFLVLIAASLGMLYFDLYGAKDLAVNAFRLEDPTKNQLNAVAQKEQALAEREKALAVREDAFTEEQKKAQQEQKALNKELNSREKTISAKEKELAALQASIDEKQAELNELAAKLEIKRIDITTAVEMFAGMDPYKAAKALEGIESPADIALLLLYMDSDKSAEILNEMKTKLASSVMQEITALKEANALPPAPSPAP
ncbi:MAG TPA: hypothetical protein VN366_12245 [Feifaniaceae bacterium]|nr:hypothetical protein [Feifaniaceae bacterium]